MWGTICIHLQTVERTKNSSAEGQINMETDRASSYPQGQSSDRHSCPITGLIDSRAAKEAPATEPQVTHREQELQGDSVMY